MGELKKKFDFYILSFSKIKFWLFFNSAIYINLSCTVIFDLAMIDKFSFPVIFTDIEKSSEIQSFRVIFLFYLGTFSLFKLTRCKSYQISQWYWQTNFLKLSSCLWKLMLWHNVCIDKRIFIKYWVKKHESSLKIGWHCSSRFKNSSERSNFFE